ncbi:MAG: hypothetical protein OEX12_01130 [Gammaproteobacteria bacterium]|nr:hypothetical protein [Gammaproteobacteria bacterium]
MFHVEQAGSEGIMNYGNEKDLIEIRLTKGAFRDIRELYEMLDGRVVSIINIDLCDLGGPVVYMYFPERDAIKIRNQGDVSYMVRKEDLMCMFMDILDKKTEGDEDD